MEVGGVLEEVSCRVRKVSVPMEEDDELSSPMEGDKAPSSPSFALLDDSIVPGGQGDGGEMMISTTTTPSTGGSLHDKQRQQVKRPRLKFEDDDQGPETDADKDKENEKRARRLDYLLKRSEFFSQALSSGAAVTEAKKRGRQPGEVKMGDNRHRKTESEEDAELLKAAEEDGAPKQGEGIGIHSAVVTFTESPPYIKNGTMRDYQIRGLNWLINIFENGINGILADEMGLGKTLQTISFIGYLKVYKGIRTHCLIVLPKSTLSNWENEIRKWCPVLRHISLIGNADQRKATINDRLRHLATWDVLLTTYEMVLKEKSTLKKIHWTCLVIDEAHRIKNENSQLSDAVRMLDSQSRLLLTGTPLQNNLHELWALLNFLLPDVFNSAELFDDWFNTETCLGDNTLVQRLQSVLRPFLLRRIKAEVEKNLPPKKEIKVYVPLSSMQREWYRKILMRDLDKINGVGKVEKVRLMNILMHLRKCCNHPYLFDGAEPGPPYTNDVHLVNNCGKMMVLDKLLLKLQSEGSRVLIFSQMTRFLDVLEDYCFLRKLSYHRLDGNTAHEDRQRMIDEYNSPNSPTFIFMLSTRAGGLGINLATADVVILYDSDWNPQMDLQAMDRAHRIGQTKQVRVFRLVTECTVEEKIVERAAVKLKLDKLVIQQGRLADSDTKLKGNDLLGWIKFGASIVLSSTGNETIPDETIEAILSRSKLKEDELNSKLDEIKESNLRNFTLEEATSNIQKVDSENSQPSSSTGFTGVLPSDWIELPKRKRTAVYTNMANLTDAAEEREQLMRAPKPPKHPKLPDFQFYPRRLHVLLEKEVHYFQKTIKYKVPLLEGDKAARKAQKFEQKKIDLAKPLTKAELAEKEELLQRGYDTWTRRDFQHFLKLLERHGRANMDIVAEEFGNAKSPEQVMEYASVFFRRFSELQNHEKIFQQISKCEEKRFRKEHVEREISRRIAHCRRPLFELNLPHHVKGRGASSFTLSNDRFLVIAWHKYHFDTEDETFHTIRGEILQSTEFRFDWFLKSRNIDDLRRRLQHLWSQLEKDIVTLEVILDIRERMAQTWKLETQNDMIGSDEDDDLFENSITNGDGVEMTDTAAGKQESQGSTSSSSSSAASSLLGRTTSSSRRNSVTNKVLVDIQDMDVSGMSSGGGSPSGSSQQKKRGRKRKRFTT